MSDNDGSEMEVEDQSEDGELTKSPHKHSPMPLSKDMVGSYGLSDEDAEDTADSLDIKPPQATVLHHHKSSRSSSGNKREKHSERTSSGRREHIHGSKSDSHRKGHHRSREHRERHEERMREKHHHRERREHKPMVERGERVLEDLRERLLDKRRSENERRMKMERRERERRVVEEEPVQVLPPPPRETPREKAERLEKELRRERLLEADREMARQKDAYRRELEARRERRHLEKEKERTLREMAKKRERSRSHERKKHRSEDVERSKEMEADGVTFLGGLKDELSQQVVTVSDDSEEEEETGSGVESGKGNHTDAVVHGQEMDEEDEVSSLAEEEEEEEEEDEEEEDEEEESESSSATEEDGGDTEESVRQNTDAEEPYSNRGSPVTAVEHNSPAGSEVSQNQNEVSKLEATENKGNQVDENGIPFINDESPKSDVVLQDSLPPYLPAIQGCRSVEEFQCLNRIEEGTYGVVYRARDKRTNEVVALKRLKMEKEKEGFPITSLREINTLLKAQHPNIVTVREIVVGSNMDKIFIVMDYVEHDLKSLMETMKQKKQCFIPGEVKCLMLQLLRAVAHLHDNWILHRDLKTSNLLLSHKGILKVGDFGLAREYGSPLRGYTPIVVTLWYRAPELLLCTKEYSTPVDMWSVGCIFGEFLSMEALFPGKSEVDQLNRIFKDLGTPNERIWPGYGKLPAVQKMTFTEYPVNQLRQRFGTMITEVGMDLMNRFLTYDPVQRVTAEDALRHAYFSEAPLPIDPAMFPTWPAKSELGHRKAAAASPKPPPGGLEYKQLGDDEEVPAGGFHMGVTEKGRIAVGGGFSLKF